MRLILKFCAAVFVVLAASCMAGARDDNQTASPDRVTVFLGDSNIWLAGDSCDNPQGWAAWLHDMRDIPDCMSYARSGATWSHTADTRVNTAENIAVLGDNNVIYNQVLRLIDAADRGVQAEPTLLLLCAGGNDAWFSNRRPHEFDLTVDQAFEMADSALLTLEPRQVLSLPQVIRYDCLQLRRRFPDAAIVLLTPMQMGKVEPEMLLRVSELIDSAATRLGLPVIRLDGDEPICRNVELATPTDTYDGTHTSKKGAEKVASFVSARLDTILSAPAH